MRSTVSEKGQVTVPKALRDTLGIRPGDELEFVEERGRLVVSKALPADPVAAAYGVLSLGRTTDEALDDLRGAPDAV